MKTIPELTHDILNSLNNITVACGTLCDKLNLEGDISADYLAKALKEMEDAAVKAADGLGEIKRILKQEERYR